MAVLLLSRADKGLLFLQSILFSHASSFCSAHQLRHDNEIMGIFVLCAVDILIIISALNSIWTLPSIDFCGSKGLYFQGWSRLCLRCVPLSCVQLKRMHCLQTFAYLQPAASRKWRAVFPTKSQCFSRKKKKMTLSQQLYFQIPVGWTRSWAV